MIELRETSGGVILPLQVKAGSRRAGILGERAGALLVAVSAAPERGKANAAVIELLAASLDLRAADLSLVAGPTSPRKSILVADYSAAALQPRLEALLAEAAS
jgi:uncharacterized protein YggU (UPF0235/DUF167 family)